MKNSKKKLKKRIMIAFLVVAIISAVLAVVPEVYSLKKESSATPDDATVTTGIISNTSHYSSSTTFEAFKTDCSIHGGNSRGPLVDEKENVVGINTLSSVSDENMHWAICSNELIDILDDCHADYELSDGNASTISGRMTVIFGLISGISILGFIILLIMSFAEEKEIKYNRYPKQ